MNQVKRTALESWRQFWSVGGLWRAAAVAVAFVAVTLGLGWLLTALTGVAPGAGEPFGGARAVVVSAILPTVIAGALAVAFVISVGWSREIFGRQERRGRTGLWIGVCVLTALVLARLVVIDFGSLGLSVIGLLVLFAACVGFSEELAFRGIVTQLLRRGGDRERDVALGTASLFALMHIANWVGLEGLSPINGLGIVGQVLFAFGTGVILHCVLIITGRLWWPMLLHAAINAGTFLLVAQQMTDWGGLAAAPAILTVVIGIGSVALGIGMLFLIDGRVGRSTFGLPETEGAERLQATP